jgi:hypothetical protein
MRKKTLTLPANAEGRRGRRHYLFVASHRRIFVASRFRAGRSNGTGGMAESQCSHRCAGIEPCPFAGIAFLWFIGVLRHRLAQREDRFFATVFFGSGLLFLAMLFVAAAMIGAIILAFADQPDGLIDSATFHLSRAFAYGLVNIYMIKIAGVFMISTSTVAVYTGFAPRWIALLGYGLALIVLFGSYYIEWCFVVFPLWVLLLSTYILIDNLRRPDPEAKRL